MKSQKQCDKMKQVCIDNGLNYYWNDVTSFKYVKDKWYYFVADDIDCFLVSNDNFKKNQVSEQEFLQLLKEYNDGK
jgi:hypothetical protein